mgnify:CR=1 FL=1
MKAPTHLNALRAFEAAARHGSFSGAADELNVTAAAVGQLVRGLEEWLGAPLFHRGSSGKTRLVPTDLAERSLPDIRAGFDRLTLGMERMIVGPLEFYDKIPLKKHLDRQGVRVVPPGVARYGSHLEPTAILMPGYVNIGARVGAGTMVDTWATVGSCAQIGKHVHLSGGVGIGGVLEPPGARPVIVEDGAFVGSRAIVVEGVRVGREAVLGANVVLTASTVIVDVRGSEPVELRGYVPPRAVVIPGTRPKKFPAGEFHVPCALIIGERKPSTDQKTSLNEALRDFGVAV